MTKQQGTEIINKTKKLRITIFALYIITLVIPVIIWLLLLINLQADVTTVDLAVSGLLLQPPFWIASLAVLYKAIRILNAKDDIYKLRRDINSIIILFSVYLAFAFVSAILFIIGSAWMKDKSNDPVRFNFATVFVVILFVLVLTLVIIPSLIIKKIPKEPVFVRAQIIKDDNEQLSEEEIENKKLKQELIKLKNEKMKKEIEKLKKSK